MKLRDLIRQEFIGRYAEVTEAKNKCLIGVKGKIVDETKNMLTIATQHGEKKLIKDQIVLNVHFNGKIYRIEGKYLIGRPEERLKKKIKNV